MGQPFGNDNKELNEMIKLWKEKYEETIESTLGNEAKSIISGIAKRDVSKLKVLTKLRQIADQFVKTLKKDIPEEAKKKLQPLRDELAKMAHDAETKFGLRKDKPNTDEKEKDNLLAPLKDTIYGLDKNQLKELEEKVVAAYANGDKAEVARLLQPFGNDNKELNEMIKLWKEKYEETIESTLGNEAKSIISGIAKRDVSKLKALTKLRQIADQFVKTLKKDIPEEAKKKLQPLRDELAKIAHDAETKFGLRKD